jgi:hypothetical protein
MAQNNDGPGKRLKREQAKNTLYVNNPNDPRLRMYQDSLGTFNNINRYYSEMSKIKDNQFPSNNELIEYSENIKKKYPVNSNLLTIEPISGKNFTKRVITGGEFIDLHQNASAKSPKQKVVFRREKIEPLTPLQAKFAAPEIVQPAVRPVPQPNIEPQDSAMGSSLRYPAQNFMNKLKARITGTPNMPYWVDREGVRRYPSMGENTLQDVRMMEMLKSGLNPNVPEDAAELKRIDLLRKMRSKDRKEFMGSYPIAQE